jgi:cation diffusion facilitator family transporter
MDQVTEESSNSAIVTSFVVSIFDFSVNLTVAIISGSAVLLSQALQGLSDLTTAGALLFGDRRSRRAPDETYQFGYGRELFFYAALAIVMMFIGTGLLSVYFGWQQLVDPSPLQAVELGIGLLTIGLLGNAFAARRSAQKLNSTHANQTLLMRAKSSLIGTKTTFVIDSIGTVAAGLGLISLTLYAFTQNTVFDGVGSILIGLLTMSSAVLLLRDVKGLIVGRAVPPSVAEQIKTAALKVEHVQQILDLRTMYLGPQQLLVIIEVHLNDNLNTDEIEHITDTVKHQVKTELPQARVIQVEVETPDAELSQQ